MLGTISPGLRREEGGSGSDGVKGKGDESGRRGGKEEENRQLGKREAMGCGHTVM